jgi:hypothetical protein
MSDIIIVEVMGEAPIIVVEGEPTIIEQTVALDGIGLPKGGTTAQFLKKKSSVDYEYEWGNAITSGTAPPTGGSDGDIYLQYI